MVPRLALCCGLIRICLGDNVQHGGVAAAELEISRAIVGVLIAILVNEELCNRKDSG
jgi:hypothetical protein